MVEESKKSKKKVIKTNSKSPSPKPEETITFSSVCEDIINFKGPHPYKNISIHSCFVTVLHLANEKNLRFANDGEDFRIFREVAE